VGCRTRPIVSKYYIPSKGCFRVSTSVSLDCRPQARIRGKILATILCFSRPAQRSGDRKHPWTTAVCLCTCTQSSHLYPFLRLAYPSTWSLPSLFSRSIFPPRAQPRLSHRAGPTACHPNGGANYCSGFMTLHHTATFLGRNPCSRIPGGRLKSRPRGRRCANQHIVLHLRRPY
jgi:hypothetical protein